MPLIRITEQAIAKSKPPMAGWNLVKIEAFKEEPNKDKVSKDWTFDLVIIKSMQGEDQIGRYCYARFYSKAPGFLLSTGFLPACYEKEIDEAFDFNPDELIGKEIWAETKDDIYQGKPQKKTELFAPANNPPF